jgi:hypothetical protein
MVHYGMQYAKLIEISAKAVAWRRVNLNEAQRDVEEIEKKLEIALAVQKKADEEYQAEYSILVVRLQRNPFKAVEMYREDTGSYPI